MIEIKGLCKSFGADEVLKGIDLSIAEKEVPRGQARARFCAA